MFVLLFLFALRAEQRGSKVMRAERRVRTHAVRQLMPGDELALLQGVVIDHTLQGASRLFSVCGVRAARHTLPNAQPAMSVAQ